VTSAAGPPLLHLDGLRSGYGRAEVLHGLTLDAAAGSVVTVIGPNGAGKSTCFNMLNGQLRPDAGTVRLKGRDITGLAPRKVWRLGVGRTFQITATFGSMTVLENVQMALLSHHRRLGGLWSPVARQDRAPAEALLARLGMAAQAARPCGILAYGDLKRVELAIALANEPSLLLMDEPTAGMAPQERVGLMALTAAIARESGIAVLFTEHDMDVVFGHADRILVLDRGTLIAEGPPAMVRADPRVREVYLGTGATQGGQ
jgi:branched-chain amino acid transport system ATP-binding protein